MVSQLRPYQTLLVEQILKARDAETPMAVDLRRGRPSSIVDDHNFFPVPNDTTVVGASYAQMEARIWRVGRVRPSVSFVDFVGRVRPEYLPPNRIVLPDLLLTDEERWYSYIRPYRGSKASLAASRYFAHFYNFGKRYGKRRPVFCEYLHQPLLDLVNHRDPYSNFPSPHSPPRDEYGEWTYNPAWYYERAAHERPPFDQTVTTHPRNRIPGAVT